MLISYRIKSDKDLSLSGFKFKLQDDGFAYIEIQKSNEKYFKQIFRNKDIEQADYKKVVRRTRKAKEDVLSNEG